jgi:hypothetical protein
MQLPVCPMINIGSCRYAAVEAVGERACKHGEVFRHSRTPRADGRSRVAGESDEHGHSTLAEQE